MTSDLLTKGNEAHVYRLFVEGPDSFGDIFADNMINTPAIASSGPEAMKAAIKRYSDAIGDLEVKIEAQFEVGPDNDVVATAWRIRGFHVGDFEMPLGVAKATNELVDFQLITVARFKDEKVVERWGHI